MILRLVCAAIIVLCSSFAALAQGDEKLQDAIETWLSGNDVASLPQLSTLAASGNTSARLLLGRIETEDLGASPYLMSLNLGQRKALFRRATHSAFGESWLSFEAKSGNELAQALLDANRPEANLEVIRSLTEFGEHQATDHAVRILALYGTEEEKTDLLNSPALLPELKPYLEYLSGTPEPRGDGLAALRHMAPQKQDRVKPDDPDSIGMAGFLALGLGFGDHSEANTWRPVVEDWLMTDRAVRPIASLCRARCPNAAPQCAFAFLGLSGGYFEAIRYDSPLEALIPQQRYVDSPRARLTVLRRSVRARTETNLQWLSELPELAQISQCAVDTIQGERAKYE